MLIEVYLWCALNGDGLRCSIMTWIVTVVVRRKCSLHNCIVMTVIVEIELQSVHLSDQIVK